MNVDVPSSASVLLINAVGRDDADPAMTLLAQGLRGRGCTVLRSWIPSGLHAGDALGESLWPAARRDALAVLASLRESTGRPAVAVGVGLGGLLAIDLALDGRVVAVAAWEPDLGFPNTLDASWRADQERFVTSDFEWHGSYLAVQPLRVALSQLRGRRLPVPGLLIGDVASDRVVDHHWVSDPRLRHLVVQVSTNGDSTRSTPECATGWTLDDSVRTISDWIEQLGPGSALSSVRADGRVVEPAASPSEGRGSIFVSYRHGIEGEVRANHVRDHLLAAGFRTFFDRHSTTPDDMVSIVDRVITEDCSGGVLVLTGDVNESNFIKRHEVTRLLAHAARHGLTIAVDNAVRKPDDPVRIDPRAPLMLLGLDEGSLDNFVQYDLSSLDNEPNYGMEKFLRDSLAARLTTLRNQVVLVDIHTYPALESDLHDNKAADLRIRLPLPMGAKDHELRRQALARIALTLPLIGRALHAASPERVVVSGGGSLPIALALGGMLSATRLQCPVVVQGRHKDVWGLPDSEAHDPRVHVLSAPTTLALTKATAGSGRVAILIGGDETNQPLFHDFVSRLVTPLAGACVITYERAEGQPAAPVGQPDFIDPREGARLAAEIATTIRRYAEEHNAREILLVHALNFPLAVLLGRRLNKFRVVAYDLIDKAWYRRMLALDPTDAQIETVFPEDPDEPEQPETFR